MPRVTANQRRAQVHAVSENIRREAARIAQETGWNMADAESAVFADPELLQQCHQVSPIASFPAKWTEPEE